jgi:hypothetical protein
LTAEWEIDLGYPCNVEEVQIAWRGGFKKYQFEISTSEKAGSNGSLRADETQAVEMAPQATIDGRALVICHAQTLDCNQVSVIPLRKTGAFDTQFVKIAIKLAPTRLVVINCIYYACTLSSHFACF